MAAVLKVLLTAAVILVVFWVVRYRARVSVLKAAVNAAKKTAEGEKAGVPLSLVACAKCGTYNAVGVVCACTSKQPT
jgi:hypothetical protein